uniref:Uncharacterized protein n=1 Tax=Oryza rufipogon TaxID=4529 RepID=A0A0E0P838_ORYRU
MRREQENAGATSALLAGRGDGTDKEGGGGRATNGDGHRADDGGCAMGRRRRYRCNGTFGYLLLVTSPSGRRRLRLSPMYFVLSIASAGKKNMSGSYGGSTQMLIEMVLDLGAVVLNCRESDHEFVVTVNIFLALRGLLWFLSHGNMMEELMSEIKVMDMVWNCKFFGTPLLIMDITILRTAQVIDQDLGFCSPAWLGFRIGCLPGNLIFTCFSRGAFVDPRKHREHQYGQAARHCRAPDSSISKARS